LEGKLLSRPGSESGVEGLERRNGMAGLSGLGGGRF